MARPTARLIVLIAATLVTSAGFAAQRSYVKHLSAPPGGRLTFVADVGSVVVVGGHGHEVIVHAHLQGSHSFVTRVHISARESASGVTISVREAHRGWLHWFSFEHSHARFSIEVPSDYPVDLRTSGGDVEVQQIDAAVNATTSGGDARVRNITGSVHIRSSGGDIGADHVDGAIQLSTSGGDLTVGDSTGALDLRTSGGDIHLHSDDGAVHALTSGGDIHAQLKANDGIHMRSSGGDITVMLPKDTHASIEAGANGGDVSCEFPLSTVQISGGSHLRGNVAGGGPPIVLHASGGDIRIAPQR